MARLQAGIAVQAATSARTTAAGIADPANTAIVLTAPFTGTDVDADFAGEVAKAALAMGQDEVTKAEARATEAVKAAEAAEAAAKRANAQVAPAFKAAAAAARSSADAARSSAAAMKSAAQAAEDGAKARAAAARANEADAQAQADAKLARQAANQAFADAAAARNAATQAEAEAARARGAAADAENHAAAANSAANLAEQEASVAQGAAAQAEKDAADANKFAESAEKHAASAETAAKNAGTYAKEADEAAKKAEEYQRELERKEREEAARSGKEVSSGDLTDAERKALEAAGISVAEFEAAKALAQQNLHRLPQGERRRTPRRTRRRGDQGMLGRPGHPHLPVGGRGEPAVDEGGPPWSPSCPKIGKAILGIKDFLDKAAEAKRTVKKAEEVIEKVQKKIPDCLGKSKKKPTPKSSMARSAAAKADDDDECLTAETVIYRSPATGKRESEKNGLNPANHGGGYPTAYYANLPEGAAQYAGNGHDLGFHRYVMKPGFRKAFGDLEFPLENKNKFPGLTEWRIPASRAAEFNSYIDHSKTEWWDAALGSYYPPAG
ncbi:hypothetical protein RB196_19125 [Streptomyces sp. PmtA]|uniref:hypothetical protein n=1 Tax=Streptomyces sp. PmtA TaxID=3074275 RepID=UPI003014249D